MMEKKAHDLIRCLIQNIWDEHKLCITDINIKWLTVSGMPGPEKFITDVEIRSETNSAYASG